MTAPLNVIKRRVKVGANVLDQQPQGFRGPGAFEGQSPMVGFE